MVTPSPDQQAPGYATLTIASVTVESGFEASGEFTNNFVVTDGSGDRAFDTKVVDIPLEKRRGRWVPQNSDTEVFAIGIHSIYDTPVTASEEERPEVGVGSGQLETSAEFGPSPRGDDSSLIGLKILETGTHTNIDVPIYPISGLTDLRFVDVTPKGIEDPDPLPVPQQFPPTGGAGPPSVQAAVYNEFVFISALPPVAASSDVVEVTGGLNPAEKAPLRLMRDDGTLERFEPPVIEEPS